MMLVSKGVKHYMKSKFVFSLLFLVVVSTINLKDAVALSEITVSSPAVDFGDVFDTKTATIIVKNDFLRRVHLSLTITSSASSVSFSVQPNALNLDASGSETVVITALQTGTALGLKTGVMKITGSVSSLTGLRPLNENEEKSVSLKATIRDFFDTFPGDEVDFGSFKQGTAVVRSVTLKANANINLSFSGISAPFQIDAAGIVPLAAGNQRVVHVTVPTNTSVGTFNGTMKVTAQVQKSIPPLHPVEQSESILVKASIISAQPPPPPPPPPSAQSDLSPQLLGAPTVTPPQGTTKAKISFQLKVSNSGSDSVACEAKVLLDGNVEKTITLPAIAAGGSNTQDVSFRTGKSGQHQLSVKVDSNDANAESNESNNVLAPVTVEIP